MHDEIIAEVLSGSTVQRQGCTVGGLLESLDDDARAAYEHVLTLKAATAPAIARSIAARYGVELNPKTIQRHRRGECSCGRS